MSWDSSCDGQDDSNEYRSNLDRGLDAITGIAEQVVQLQEENTRLKELNREMVEALKHINELWNTRPQPGLRDKWDNAIETAGEVLAKAEGED